MFAEVLLPIPVPGTFTYRVPFDLNDQVRVGQRAVVQFGKTKIMSGLIVSLTEQVPSVEVKYLTGLLDAQPIVNGKQLKFWEWVKDPDITTAENLKKLLAKKYNIKENCNLMMMMIAFIAGADAGADIAAAIMSE